MSQCPWQGPRPSIPPPAVIDNHAYRFSVDGKYLYVSRKNHSSNVVVSMPHPQNGVVALPV